MPDRPPSVLVIHDKSVRAAIIEAGSREAAHDRVTVIIRAVSRLGQRHWRGALSGLPSAMREIGHDHPVLIGVGKVFAFRSVRSAAMPGAALAVANLTR